MRATAAYLYGLDFALWITHEVDSARWQEWKLFGLPGGPGLFVALHLPLMLLFLWGFAELLRGRRGGTVVGWLLVATGIAALFIHGSFLVAGLPEFRSPLSLSLIAAMPLASAALAVALLRRSRQAGVSA